MIIQFKRSRDREQVNDSRLLGRKFKGNPRRANLVRKRLDELVDAENLATMRYIPQAYCHELRGNRRGQLAVRLDKGYRLVFQVANEPIPTKADGGLDWSGVTAIRILELAEDYHDE